MAEFSQVGLSPQLLEAVDALGYEAPTPVQEQVIPLALEGRDVIACAKTGTGKTAAFCLPCMDHLPHSEKGWGPYLLIVTPTRELADQIAEVCLQIARITKHRVASVVGGVSYNPQRQALATGVDVLIATPGRLEDLISQDAAKLDQVQTLVLDEADHMLDLGFLPAVKRIEKACTARTQTLLFSATMNDRVEQIARDFLQDSVRVEVSRSGETADTVEQHLIRISHAAKPSCLKAILYEQGPDRVLVFCRTKHRVDGVVQRLKRLGYSAEAIHSDRNQSQRTRALTRFASGEAEILVATDVLARGIDIDNVNYVVNYDLPQKAEDYVHRIGRTGRAGAAGMTISLVTPEAEDTLREIEQLTGKKIPTMRLTSFDMTAAEAEAEIRSMQLQARREHDPEIDAVVRELAAKKKRERKAAAQTGSNKAHGKTSTKSSSKTNSPSKKAASKQRTGAGSASYGKNAKPKRKKR